MKTKLFIIAATALCLGISANAQMRIPYDGQPLTEINGIDMTKVEYNQFQNPDKEFRGSHFISLYLDRSTEESLVETVERDMTTDLWGTFLMIPTGTPTSRGLSDDYMAKSHRRKMETGTIYLSEEYFKMYRAAIEKGLELGFKCTTIYDDYEFPSGTVSGLFYTNYPDLCRKNLEILEVETAKKGEKVSLDLPEEGLYMGSVAMNMDTFERIDVSKNFKNGKLSWTSPAGNWKLMFFYLDTSFFPQSMQGGCVDYLDKEAVQKYIELNFEPYYKHLGDYFGSVIRRTFYDEPTLMEGVCTWTPKFNEGFKERYGYDPITLYPALWYNIGEDTQAARNALHKYRTELWAENYIGQVSTWCEAHGIKMGGHIDQEEAVNPVGANGDLMKTFKYQGIPASDDIFYPGRANVGYKVVTSSAYNWDKPEVFTETFAAYGGFGRQISPETYRRVTLDQFAMGTNIQIEFENKVEGVDYMIGRLGYMLRGGRHTADIAVIYPIAALQSAYILPPKEMSGRHYAYMGGIIPAEIDYMDIGESLFRGLHLDYTYLHPEVLVEKCTVEGNELKLNNVNNWEQYKVLILPGGDTFSADAAAKILEFYRAGGTVIATSKLPNKSAEFGRDKEVRDMVYEVFGMSDNKQMTAKVRHARARFLNIFYKTNENGGRSYFISNPYTPVLEEILNEALPVKDVNMGAAPEYYRKTDSDYDGGITYTHKVRGGKDIYFFANTKDKALETTASVRGTKKNLEYWDPQDGSRETATAEYKESRNGEQYTSFKLSIPALSGLFVIAE